MDIRPNFLCDTTTSVVLHLRPCSSALSVQNLSSFFVEYCKSHGPADIPGTRWLDATFCSCNSAYEVGRPASEALCPACIFALIPPRYGRRVAPLGHSWAGFFLPVGAVLVPAFCRIRNFRGLLAA